MTLNEVNYIELISARKSCHLYLLFSILVNISRYLWIKDTLKKTASGRSRVAERSPYIPKVESLSPTTDAANEREKISKIQFKKE